MSRTICSYVSVRAFTTSLCGVTFGLCESQRMPLACIDWFICSMVCASALL